VHNKITRLLRW